MCPLIIYFRFTYRHSLCKPVRKLQVFNEAFAALWLRSPFFWDVRLHHWVTGA
jgi:hypothetical protein